MDLGSGTQSAAVVLGPRDLYMCKMGVLAEGGLLCGGHSGVYHTKVLSRAKKERNQWVSLWSKVFLDKSITNRTIGQSLRVDFSKSKTNLYNQQTKKRKGETLIYWPSCTAGNDLLATVNGF